jgi:hypothetical protein
MTQDAVLAAMDARINAGRDRLPADQRADYTAGMIAGLDQLRVLFAAAIAGPEALARATRRVDVLPGQPGPAATRAGVRLAWEIGADLLDLAGVR